MRVRYRFAPYGTSFEPKQGTRLGNDDPDAGLLFENEIAADIGQQYWTPDPNRRAGGVPVIDHHFMREQQFPSASAAVLHSAAKVNAWWSACSLAGFNEVWLVTHENPDFDALASLYLVNSLRGWNELNAPEMGLAADSWRDLTRAEIPGGRRRFDWFSAPVVATEPDVRWRLSLAVVASMADNCRRFGCAKTQTAPAIFYAALQRGGLTAADGATLFFDDFRDAIVRRHKNAVIDAIFDTDSRFAPEIELLGREVAAYERDLARAHTSIVVLPQYGAEFEAYYSERREMPLFCDDGTLDQLHTSTGSPPRAADGIFVRDPESLLFKDLARMDNDHTSLGQGFMFTAVALSHGRPDGARNRSEYYFAIDPEHAARQTLYPLWARLEAAEVEALSQSEKEMLSPLTPREHYQKRAGSLGGLLHDPWFDGANYNTTIIATPHRGTSIGPAGTASDLSDDPVARIVREALHNVYSGKAHCVDFSEGRVIREASLNAEQPRQQRIPADFRLCTVRLVDGLDLSGAAFSRQIGEQLWRLLHQEGDGIPDDFDSRHLARRRDSIAVWSRRGIAFACREGNLEPNLIDRTERQFQRIMDLLHRAHFQEETNSAVALRQSESLLQEISLLRQELAGPDSSVAIRRFVDAVGFHDTLGTIRDLLDAQRGRRLARATRVSITALRAGQEKVELLETLIVALYAIELGHIIIDGLSRIPDGLIEVRILCLLGTIVTATVWWGLRKRDKARARDRKTIFNPLTLIPVFTIILLLSGFLVTFPPMFDWYRSMARSDRRVDTPVVPRSSATAATGRAK